MTLTITHAKVTSGTTNNNVEVDLADWNDNHIISGSIDATDVTNAAALTRTNDTNVTITLGGTPTTALLAATSITVGWTGTLAAGRLNSNVVQGVTNDTNVTGSISAQNLTLGWSGTLAATRGGFGADVSGSSGVPLFATGTATFTGTTGSGNFVRATSPTLVTPALGTPASGTLTNATGLPLSTGVTGQLPLANGGTGASLADPNADRFMFWDDSAGATAYLAPGNGVSISGTTFNVAVDASTLPAANDTVTLPAIRKRLRNLPDLLDYGSTSDMTSAMNAAQTAAASEGWRRIVIPAGTWVQGTAPNDITRGMLFDGEDRSQSIVSINHTGSAFKFTGQNGGGGGVRNCFIQISGSTNALSGIYAVANQDGYAPDGLEIDNVWITYQSTGRYTYGVLMDGGARGTALVSGSLTSTPGSNVLTNTAASYGTNQFATGLLQVRMTNGTASGQVRTITSNTATTITLASAFSPQATSGNTYVVESVLYGLRDIFVSRVTTFGTSDSGMLIQNNRGAHYRDILVNGVGGVSTVKIIGGTSGVSEINNGVTVNGLICGEILLNNTTGLVGDCIPQGGFNRGSGLTNCVLLVASGYQNIGTTNPGAGGGLELPT